MWHDTSRRNTKGPFADARMPPTHPCSCADLILIMANPSRLLFVCNYPILVVVNVKIFD